MNLELIDYALISASIITIGMMFVYIKQVM